LIFIIDTNKEELAVKESQKLGIPIVAIVDSNCTVDGITYPIPGNDDSTRAIRLYCRLMSDAVLGGIQQSMVATGTDLGAREDATEVLPLETSEVASVAEPQLPPPPQAAPAASEEAGEEKKKGGRSRKSGSSAPKKAPTVQVKKTPGKGKKGEE
jgi:small subunit ribosomal protein S2